MGRPEKEKLAIEYPKLTFTAKLLCLAAIWLPESVARDSCKNMNHKKDKYQSITLHFFLTALEKWKKNDNSINFNDW